MSFDPFVSDAMCVAIHEQDEYDRAVAEYDEADAIGHAELERIEAQQAQEYFDKLLAGVLKDAENGLSQARHAFPVGSEARKVLDQMVADLQDIQEGEI